MCWKYFKSSKAAKESAILAATKPSAASSKYGEAVLDPFSFYSNFSLSVLLLGTSTKIQEDQDTALS